MGYGRIRYEVAPPSGVEVVRSGETTRYREAHGGATIGELEITMFKAALVIDRDGILEEKVRAAIASEVGAVVYEPGMIEVPGASGWQISAEYVRGAQRPALPYVYVYALASDDLGIDGGVLVTVRSASPQWPAADQIVESLKIVSRTNPANR